MRSLINEADAREIEAAVARVEAKSSVELVVAVVPRSHDYWQPRVLLSAAWALGAGFAFLHFAPYTEPALALLLEVAVAALAFVISGTAPVRKVLVPERAAANAVSARAFQLFAERGLYGTHARTALLIFVSELERRVVLLGDRLIHAELGEAGWDKDVQLLVGYLKRGEAKQGILAVIAELEPHLVSVAPRAADDVNELPDEVLRA